jgi:hypothetical protein
LKFIDDENTNFEIEYEIKLTTEDNTVEQHYIEIPYERKIEQRNGGDDKG